MKIYIVFALAVFLATPNIKAADAPAAVFSALTPGQTLPVQFRVLTVPKVASNRFSLVADEDKSVLQVDSEKSAGSLGLPMTTTSKSVNTQVEWRWKVSRLLDKADMATKTGDDFAARVYVFFDVPLQSLPFAERTKLRLARLIAGDDVPTAALCYVWDNSHRVGHTQWSPYTNRVRMIVLQSGAANVGKWMAESRDVAADFREAFGVDAPAVTGVAIGNDSDNTGERVTTWFGDVTMKSK